MDRGFLSKSQSGASGPRFCPEHKSRDVIIPVCILGAINLNFFPSQHKSSTEYRVSAAVCSVKRLP